MLIGSYLVAERKVKNVAKLGLSFIKSLDVVTKNGVFWDNELKGFGLRIQNNARSYVIKYRNKYGCQRWLTIGQAGKITPDEARKIAKDKLADIIKGEDPATDKQESRKALTVGELCDWYMKEGTSHKKTSTLEIDAGRIRNHIKPLLGNEAVKNVNRGMIEKMMFDIIKGDKIAQCKKSGKLRGKTQVKGGNTASSRTVQLLGAIFEFAKDHSIIGNNPAHGIKKPKANAKDVFLTIDEIKTLGKILEPPQWQTLHKQAVDAIKLLLLTGCRKNEILGLKWEYIDFDYQCFRFPDTKTGKQNRPFGLGALRLLQTLRIKHHQKGWVFPAKTGQDHYMGLPKTFQDILATKDVNGQRILDKDGVTIHTLRHTFSSLGADMGFTEFTLAGLLGHHLQGTTNRYSHAVDKSLVSAGDIISLKIEQALAGIDEQRAKVISIERVV